MNQQLRVSRPAIPAAIRRAVLVEAGHKCAIPRCGHADVDIHHIIPWESCERHEYKNLIALCPNCHRRAHKGEIDRKSLLLYKSSLVASFQIPGSSDFTAPIIEIKRRLYEINPSYPDCIFDFEFPDFSEAEAHIVSKNIEAWGSELLSLFQHSQSAEQEKQLDEPLKNLCSLRGRYEVVRRDSRSISVRYEIQKMPFYAAHGSRETRVQNFLLAPFQPLTIEDALLSDEALEKLSEAAKNKLMEQDSHLDKQWVSSGTAPVTDNYSCFTVSDSYVTFIFDEYQVACYAAGQQTVNFTFDELVGLVKPELLEALDLNAS